MKITWFNWDRQFTLPEYENATFKLVEQTHEQLSFKNDADAIVISYETKFTDKHLHKFPNLKNIFTQSSRTDHIKINNKEIGVHAIGGQYCKQTIADRCLFYSTSLAQNIDKSIKTVGFFGFGVIGQEIAKRFSDKKIIYCDPFRTENIYGAERVDGHEIFSKSDLIILIVPTTYRTLGLITLKTKFGRQPFIFNLSSDQVANLKTIHRLYELKQICGYWHDFAPKYLSRLDHVWTTHTAWKSAQSIQARHDYTIDLLEKKLGLVVKNG